MNVDKVGNICVEVLADESAIAELVSRLKSDLTNQNEQCFISISTAKQENSEVAEHLLEQWRIENASEPRRGVKVHAIEIELQVDDAGQLDVWRGRIESAITGKDRSDEVAVPDTTPWLMTIKSPFITETTTTIDESI